jgi:hypothetical protein
MSDIKTTAENKTETAVSPKKFTGVELQVLKDKLSKVYANAMKNRGKRDSNPTIALREVGWFELEAKLLDGTITVEEADKIKKFPDEIDCVVKTKESLQKAKETLQS